MSQGGGDDLLSSSSEENFEIFDEEIEKLKALNPVLDQALDCKAESGEMKLTTRNVRHIIHVSSGICLR